jgi:membrane-bound serine protease (ClpP class)
VRLPKSLFILCACFALASVAGGVFATTAIAQGSRRALDVIEVPGVLDPPLVNYLSESIDQANEDDAYLVVVQIDSAGALDVPLARLLSKITRSDAPVVVWVGPRRAQAASGAALVVASAAAAGIAPGATLGPIHPADLTVDPKGADGRALRIDEQRVLDALPAGEDASVYLDHEVTAEQARESGVIVAPTLAEFLKGLDGRAVRGVNGDVTLRLKSDEVVIRLHKPGPVRRALHALTSAALVYLLLLFGIGLIVFELFQPGFGVAGVTGGILLVAALYGMFVLPVAWWAALLALAGMALLTLDVAKDGLAAPTIAGSLLLLVGSWFMFPVHALRTPRWLVVLGVVLAFVFFVPVMTIVRRQQRPIGREATRALIGQLGEVRSVLNPEGFVWVLGELWRARSEDGTRVRVGEPVEVTALEGHLLMVRRPA